MERKSLHPGQFFNGVQMQGAAGALMGLAAALLILLICSLIGSGLVYFTRLPESSFHVMAILIDILAMFAGGFIAAHKAGNRGLLRGLAVGLIIAILTVSGDNFWYKMLHPQKNERRKPFIFLFDYLRLGAMLGLIILDGGMQGIRRQHRAMDFDRRQAVQSLHQLLIGDLFRFFQRQTFGHFRQHAAGSDGRRAAESLELDILDHSILHIQIDESGIAAGRALHLAHAVLARAFTHIAGIIEMIQNFIVIHSYSPFEMPLILRCSSYSLIPSNLLW